MGPTGPRGDLPAGRGRVWSARRGRWTPSGRFDSAIRGRARSGRRDGPADAGRGSHSAVGARRVPALFIDFRRFTRMGPAAPRVTGRRGEVWSARWCRWTSSGGSARGARISHGHPGCASRSRSFGVAARPGRCGDQRTAVSRPGSRPRFGPAAVAITGSRIPARPPVALPSGSPLPGLQDRGSRSGPPPHSGRPRPPPAGSRSAWYRRRASASRHGADPPDRNPPLGRASRSLRVRRFRGRPIEARGPVCRRSPAGCGRAARRIENPGSAARRPRLRLHRRPDRRIERSRRGPARCGSSTRSGIPARPTRRTPFVPVSGLPASPTPSKSMI